MTATKPNVSFAKHTNPSKYLVLNIKESAHFNACIVNKKARKYFTLKLHAIARHRLKLTLRINKYASKVK